MDATQRRCWVALDRLPSYLSQVHAWHGPLRLSDGGEYHAVPTLVACLDGTVRVESDQRKLDLTAGEVLLIGAGVPHRHHRLAPGCLHWGQGFMAAWSDVVLGSAEGSRSYRVPTHPSRHLIDAAVGATDAQARRAKVLELLTQVLQESVEELHLEHEALRRMLRVLWGALHQGIQAEDLCTASGLSRAQAWQVFRRGYGVTPREAIERARVSLAAGFLAQGMSVSATATQCGWASADVFTRAWRRAHGSSPRQAVMAARREKPGKKTKKKPD